MSFLTVSRETPTLMSVIISLLGVASAARPSSSEAFFCTRLLKVGSLFEPVVLGERSSVIIHPVRRFLNVRINIPSVLKNEKGPDSSSSFQRLVTPASF